MKDITIAIHTPNFPNIVQPYILSLIVALKKGGTETIVIAEHCSKGHDLSPEILKYRILENTIYISTTYTGFIKELLTLPIYNAAYRDIMSRILTSKSWRKYGWRYFLKEFVRAKSLFFHKFNLIHSHTLVGSYDHMFIRDIFSIPIITTFHGKEPINSKSLPPDKTRMVFQHGDLFLVNTNYGKQVLMGLGCPIEKIYIIPQGINLDNFPYSSHSIKSASNIILLTVGRLSIEKGHQIAIDAVAKLSEAYPALEYYIIGDGPEMKNLYNHASRLNMKNRIKFLGPKSTEQLQNYYSMAHIFILPSTEETQGVVIQEAQSSGLPVIASATGGIPESVIDNKTGLLFKEGDSNDLAEKIRLLIESPDLYVQISHAGRHDVVNRFSINTIAKSMGDLYRSVVEHNPIVSATRPVK